ncbi:hypothetical protein [Deinococcus sp. QL22]|uniref:hypothetical protein n=1 Tax=Deinococcus sp. QL22 TaxID=2939437 RepID=UPI0020183304|nr:hypothetical protein [Deinococcus sp. QL22]UQN10568.1 hypothetical protein M1R55_30680 [Deinococcus sp. QL22]
MAARSADQHIHTCLGIDRQFRILISSLAGGGKGLLWPRLDHRSIETLVRTMNLVSPVDADALRQNLRLPEGWIGLEVKQQTPPQAELDRARAEADQHYRRTFSDAGIARRRLLQGRDLDDELITSQGCVAFIRGRVWGGREGWPESQATPAATVDQVSNACL